MFVNLHTHILSNSSNTLEIKNIDNVAEFTAPTNYYSVGIHPWKINENTYKSEIEIVKKLAIKKNVIAIGECGLDKLINIDFKIQDLVFRSQIILAEQVQKPLIVHCVKAFDELIRIKKELKISVLIIVHGFNNKKEIAAQLLKNDIYLSIGKALLNENSNASKNISSLPIEKIFLETDDADVSIKSIFEAAAKQLQIDLEVLKQQIHTNFKKVFIHE